MVNFGTAQEPVSVFWFWVLCARVHIVIGKVQVEPDLVDKTIETLTSF
jgi:hypothetical protein